MFDDETPLTLYISAGIVLMTLALIYLINGTVSAIGLGSAAVSSILLVFALLGNLAAMVIILWPLFSWFVCRLFSKAKRRV